MAALSAVAPVLNKAPVVSTGKAANTNSMMVWQPHGNKCVPAPTAIPGFFSLPDRDGGESGHCDFWCDGVCVVSCEYVTMGGTRPRFSRNDPTPEIYSRGPPRPVNFWVHRPPVAPDSLSTSFSAELSRAGPRFGNPGKSPADLTVHLSQSCARISSHGEPAPLDQIRSGRIFPFDRGSR